MDEHDSQLVAALDSATTWSAYCENQLSAAVNLTNAQEDAHRVLYCIAEARHAAQLVMQHCSRFLDATSAQLTAPDEPARPGDAVQLDIAYCKRCKAQEGTAAALLACPGHAAHDWTREIPKLEPAQVTP